MGRPAARVTDIHTCLAVGGPIAAPCCPTVLIGGLPAARLGDAATCIGPPDPIVSASFTVVTGGQPQARMGDLTAKSGTIITGAFTVLVG